MIADIFNLLTAQFSTPMSTGQVLPSENVASKFLAVVEDNNLRCAKYFPFYNKCVTAFDRATLATVTLSIYMEFIIKMFQNY